MKKTLLAVLCVGLCSCQSSPGQVWQKVKYDFGIGPKPEGYEAPSERVMARLSAVGSTEMSRMNTANRHGEIKYQKEDDLHGFYYKEIKVYERFNPIETQSMTHGSQGERGYVGYITFTYRMKQSARMKNRTEAAAAAATIPTSETGRETYRYRFNSSGHWDGAKGERVRR